MVVARDLRLMPPAYVRPYVKRGKTDAKDAAICEAVTSTAQQAPLRTVRHDAAVMVVAARGCPGFVRTIRGTDG
jgi:transposase